jgi:hypothetical protein
MAVRDRTERQEAAADRTAVGTARVAWTFTRIGMVVAVRTRAAPDETIRARHMRCGGETREQGEHRDLHGRRFLRARQYATAPIMSRPLPTLALSAPLALQLLSGPLQ